MITPTLLRLRALAGEGDESSLAEFAANCRTKTAGADGVKIKGAPGTGGHRGEIAPFKARMRALADASGDVRLFVACPPLREAHLFVCTGLGHRVSRAAATAAARAAAATTLTAAATAAEKPAAAEGAAETGGGSAGGVAAERRAI